MRILLLLLTISCAIHLHAQKFNVTLSPTTKLKDVSSFHKYDDYIYSDRVFTDRLHTVRLNKVTYGLKLTKYDKDLNEVKQVSFDNGENELGPFKPFVHYGTQSIYVIYFKWQKEEAIKMYAARVNPEDLSIVYDKEVAQYDQKNQTFSRMMDILDEAKTYYQVSGDGNLAWIIHYTSAAVLSVVIDGELNVIQKPVLTPVNRHINLLLTDAYISNEGNKVFAYTDRFGRKNGLFFEMADRPGFFKDTILAKEFRTGNMRLDESKDGNRIYLAGDYYNEDYEETPGVFLGEIDVLTNSVINVKPYPYTTELITRLTDLGFTSKKKKRYFIETSQYYRMNELDDGTIVLSADIASPPKVSGFVGPIVQVFIKPDGNTIMTLIPKNQVAEISSRFFTYSYENKLITIFTDTRKNQEKERTDYDIRTHYTSGNYIPVAYVFDSEGNFVSKQILIAAGENFKGDVLIDERSRYGEGKFIIPSAWLKVSLTKNFPEIVQLVLLEIE